MEHQKCKLTAIVLCKNEEATLDTCLISLSFCDEIIVADDGSSDASVNIARRHGVHIISLARTDSFAQKRNMAMKDVKEGWVLFIDADEVVDEKFGREVQRAIQGDTEDGFFIKRQDMFLGKKLQHGETGSMWLLRLARVEKGEWKRRVHEVWAVSGQIGRIKTGELLHTPHPNLESFLSTINMYTDLEIRERYHAKRVSPLEYSWMFVQLFVYPPGKFLFNYIVKQGFLDGIPGLFHAYCMSLHSLFVRIKTLEYLRSI